MDPNAQPVENAVPPKLRVDFIVGTLGSGGAERQLYYQLRLARDLGVEARVLCLTQGEAWEEPLRDLGVPVLWVGARRSRVLRTFRIARDVKRRRPQIVQSAHFYTNLYAVAAATRARACSIGAVRNDVLVELEAHGVLGRPSLRMPDLIAANSLVGVARAQAMGRSAEDTVLLPNAVDTEEFVPPPAARAGPFTVLGIGRQVPAKRYDRFLQVIAGVRRHGDDVRGLLVGDGPEHDRLVALARATGVGEAVTFLPFTSHPLVAYHRAHALLVTSKHEGTPNVVLEAMASGLPVVALRAGGTADLVEEGKSGHLLDEGDLEGAAEALLGLSRDGERAREMGRAGRRFVIEQHGMARLARSLRALYARALSR